MFEPGRPAVQGAPQCASCINISTFGISTSQQYILGGQYNKVTIRRRTITVLQWVAGWSGCEGFEATAGHALLIERQMPMAACHIGWHLPGVDCRAGLHAHAHSKLQTGEPEQLRRHLPRTLEDEMEGT